jgi:hypothetical protein
MIITNQDLTMEEDLCREKFLSRIENPRASGDKGVYVDVHPIRAGWYSVMYLEPCEVERLTQYYRVEDFKGLEGKFVYGAWESAIGKGTWLEDIKPTRVGLVLSPLESISDKVYKAIQYIARSYFPY